jgi:hypothetical protein
MQANPTSDEMHVRLQSPTRYRYDLAKNASGSRRRKKNHRLGGIFAFGPSLQIFWFHR